MKVLLGSLATFLLLALLTWLLLRGIDTNASAYRMTLQTFDNFTLAEASLHRDVLKARAGLLRDYDTLVAAVVAMEDAVTELSARAETERLDKTPAEHLAALVDLQEDLTERFKSGNALLQNSLSFVGLMSTSRDFGTQEAHVTLKGSDLAAATLRLTRDTTPEAAKALQDQIDQFASQAPLWGPEAEAARALLAHTRLLHDLLPAVDETLKALVGTQDKPPLDEIRALFSSHQAKVEATAQRFRLALYLVALLLLILLVRVSLNMRARSLALRRRAAFEHVIAENSARLINCPPAETEARLKQVLGELSRAIGADRGYIVLAENPPRVHVWRGDGTHFPPGWPAQALTLSMRLGGLEPDILTVPDVASLPHGENKDTLIGAGVRGWACVPLIRQGRARGIMGFDACQRRRWDAFLPLPVLQLAGDAVANAIERESLDRDRARLSARLERGRRMQTIGSLASGIAHNFNNIIGAIVGYSEMIQPHLASGTRPAQFIDEIRRAAERGRDLIDNILTFGRRRDPRVQLVGVRGLIEDAASLLFASLPSGIELIIEKVPEDAFVNGEPAQLQQIILNLCSNAAQAMEGSGCIHVTAVPKEVPVQVFLSHGELTAGHYICLAVADTGPGFGQDVARRLFEPFFTTRQTGTGLGLATVQETVRDHEGAMNVQSKPAGGSRFEAWLPMAPSGTRKMPGPVMPPRGRGETVLIVEREREQLLRDEEMLAALGYEPVGFEVPADALAACQSAPGRFDIILVSDAAATPGGVELSRRLHKAAPQPPLLLATASSIDVSVDAVAEAGISELLRRPLVSTELAAALARCLRACNAE
jgi:signal transduction histidine kinase